MIFHLMAGAVAPAGGAAPGQVAAMTAAVTAFTGLLLWLGLGHRRGRVKALERVGGRLARVSGLPTWAAVPGMLSGVSLLAAVFGMYWDISLHIDDGRDPGPLANPAHYFILLGLYGIFAAGWFAIVLPREDDPVRSPVAVRLPGGWHAPLGGVLMAACASFALIGFPLDDVSHRLFGQDVTLWGPTHLMMLGGAAMTLVAVLVLLAEARLALATGRAGRGSAAADGAAGGDAAAQADGPWGSAGGGLPADSPLAARLRRARLIGSCGGMLIGLSIFQGEFDFGVPQFRLLFAPLLMAFAASLALVLARTLLGRGGALGAVAFYLVLRGALALLIGPLLGQTTPHFPLYLVEALVVEALALRVRPGSWRFGALAAAGIATLGVLAEWGWSHVWMPIPWPAHLLPGAIALALPVALAGATLGTFTAGALRLRPQIAARPRAWAAAGASLLAVAAVVALLLPTTTPRATAQIALRPLPAAQAGGASAPGVAAGAPAAGRPSSPSGSGASASGQPSSAGGASTTRYVAATIRFAPASAVRDPEWLTVTAWQGHGKLVLNRLRAVGGGTYVTTQPIPVSGSWKAMIRLQRGDALAAIPLALPADPAIPVAAVPPRAHATRAFAPDRRVLQRERRRDVPGWLWGVAGLVVLSLSSVLLLVLGWGLVRLARAGVASVDATAPASVAAPRALTHA
jgi:hypothetical protein